MSINKITVVAKAGKDLKKIPNSKRPIDETLFLEQNIVSKGIIRIENEDSKSDKK